MFNVRVLVFWDFGLGLGLGIRFVLGIVLGLGFKDYLGFRCWVLGIFV